MKDLMKSFFEVDTQRRIGVEQGIRKEFNMVVVDLFAGWGGFSLGAEQAGAEVVLAANHWGLAVAAHKANHPKTTHLCQDLNQANFYDFPDMDLLLASPACQGHSQAAQPSRKKDGTIKRHHDALRSTAWAVIACAEAKRPEAIVVENVTDFRTWGLYDIWKMALRELGYTVEEHVAMATNFGVPQRRKRLFVVATQSNAPLGLVLPKRAEPGFGPCIDWAETAGWRPVATNTPKVRERIAKARARGLGDRFLTQYVTNHPGVPLHEAIRTITTKSQWAIVDGERMRMLNVREHARGMGFPDTYRWPEGSTKEHQIKGLGNAVSPPVGRWFVEQIMKAA